MLRRKARRVQEDDAHGDPLDAVQERRVRAVLVLGGVPQADLLDGGGQGRQPRVGGPPHGDGAA
ncbi:RNA polymerase subunit sigma-70, partial [Streptomyces sp. NPDC005474]